MIYTLTLNPAIDLYIETDNMEPFIVNRTNEYEAIANGKGVNVSFILKMLDVNNIALGIGGGFTNKFIEDELSKTGIENKFVHVDGMTRINVFTNVVNKKEEFKLVNTGPEVSEAKFNELIESLNKLTEKDTLIVSGSFARGISPEKIVDIAKLSQTNQFKLVIDTNYAETVKTLPYRPFLLKPNDEELKKWFDIPDTQELSMTDFKNYCQKLLEMGAQNILLSLGSAGAMLVTPTATYIGNAAKGKVVNTACAGDTMLGTFIGSLHNEMKVEDALHKSIAAASSTAFTAGLTDFKDVPELMKQIKIEKLED